MIRLTFYGSDRGIECLLEFYRQSLEFLEFFGAFLLDTLLKMCSNHHIWWEENHLYINIIKIFLLSMRAARDRVPISIPHTRLFSVSSNIPSSFLYSASFCPRTTLLQVFSYVLNTLSENLSVHRFFNIYIIFV